MKFLTLLLALCVLPFAAPAAEPVTVKLRIAEMQQLSQAIQMLDLTYERILKVEGKPDEKVTLRYDLGAIRLPLAKDLRTINAELESFDTAKKGILKEVWGDKTPDAAADTVEARLWLVKMEPLLTATTELKLQAIKEADLKLDTNPIPVAVVAALGPILTP